jgi:hypothetical protein
MRTAVSRCGTLDIVLVKHPAAVPAPKFDIARRIAGHVAADVSAGREFDPTEFVTADWVAGLLAEQKHACADCAGDLGDVASGQWSIDRLSNALAHTRGNCQLVCGVTVAGCQQRSGARK